MSHLQPLVLGAAAKECFLIKGALVQDGGTSPSLTDLASGQQVSQHEGLYRCSAATQTYQTHDTQAWTLDDPAQIITFGQASSVVLVNFKHGLLVYGLTESPSRLHLAFLGANPRCLAIQQQRPSANCAYINAALSAGGNHLLAVCGPAESYLELWSLSPLQPLLVVDTEPQSHGTAGPIQSHS